MKHLLAQLFLRVKVGGKQSLLNHYYRVYGKRACDLVASGALLIVLAPLILMTAFFLRIFQGPGVLFSQLRPGLNGKVFKLYKFRTMQHHSGSCPEQNSDDKRLTKVGSFVRRWSLDELPQLLHVFLGDMSLVGPRPLLVEYLSLYTREQARRHEVRPGITGLAQVRGRNAIDWESKFNYDVQYVDNLTIGLDLRIFWETLLIVLSGRGVSARSVATMPRFCGSASDGVTHRTAD